MPPPEANAPASPQVAPQVVPDCPPPIQSALDAMAAEDAKTSPIGAGDWRAARDAIRSFYAARGHAPLWVGDSGLTPAGVSALARLRRADEDGLDLSAFALPKEPLAAATPDSLAQAEVVLSEAVVAYAMQASGARVAPTRISPMITARPTVAEPAAALGTVTAARGPRRGAAGVQPAAERLPRSARSIGAPARCDAAPSGAHSERPFARPRHVRSARAAGTRAARRSAAGRRKGFPGLRSAPRRRRRGVPEIARAAGDGSADAGHCRRAFGRRPVLASRGAHPRQHGDVALGAARRWARSASRSTFPTSRCG